MRIKEHDDRCMCPNCQAAHSNIDGYASGYELAPDPNQEIDPNNIQDPNFINLVIAQVLQQMQGQSLEEEEANEQFNLELDPSNLEKVPKVNTGNATGGNNIGNLWVGNTGNQMLDIDKIKLPKDGCGGNTPIGPWFQDYLTTLDIDTTNFGGPNNPSYNPVDGVKSLDKPFWMKEKFEQELTPYVKNEIQRLMKEMDIEEGSCGYSVNGEGDNKPAGSHLLKKSDLNERFQKLAGIKSLYTEQLGPRMSNPRPTGPSDPRSSKDIEFDNAQAMDKLTPDDADKLGKIQQMMDKERGMDPNAMQYGKVTFVYTEQGGRFYGLDVYKNKDQRQPSDKLRYDEANEWLKDTLNYIHEDDLIPKKYNSGLEDLDLIVDRLKELDIEADHNDFMDVSEGSITETLQIRFQKLANIK